MRKILALLLIITQSAVAQIGFSDQYQFNPIAHNPAMAGERGFFGVTSMVGYRFVGGIRPLNSSLVLSMDAQLGEDGKNAIGFQGFKSSVGLNIPNQGISFCYSKVIEAGDVIIKAGLNAGTLITPNNFGNTTLGDRALPFLGFGAAAILPKAFVSIGSPSLLAKSQYNFWSNRTTFIGAGYRIGTYENIAANFSVISGFQHNEAAVNFLHLNTKVWFTNKLGIGPSIRLSQNKQSRFAFTGELRVSQSFTLGLSYDQNPLAGYNISQFDKYNGLFQILIKYDSFLSGTDSPFMNQF